MQYDKIKKSLGNIFNSHPLLRIIFYKLLDILLLRSWHIRREIRRFKREYPGNASILDAGSGFGQYSYFLAKLSGEYSITAVDVKEEQIADCNDFFNRAGLAGRTKFQIADLTQYSAENSFNLIISIDVMEHIEDDRAVFSNFYRNLKTGGWLLISTPSDKGEAMSMNMVRAHLLKNMCAMAIMWRISPKSFMRLVLKKLKRAIPTASRVRFPGDFQ